MRILASRGVRIFLIAWIIYSVHFATNVVREHYPAFSIAQHGTFFVDEYQGFHADIFRHTNGHSVIGNQVFVSVLAAVPLFIFGPVLDRLEAYSKAKLATQGPSPAEYRIDKPIRRAFFQLVKERGLDLRFGAATAITTIFLMAPATALFLVFFHRILRRRGVPPDQAVMLTFVLGLGTPLFYRTSTLNHNLFIMYAMFGSWALLWRPDGEPVSRGRLALAGLLGGITLATDYIGVIILPLLYFYFILSRMRTTTFTTAFRESLVYVAGTLPPVAFVLWSQWVMYGNPFLPGQAWMPDQNIYVNQGARGFTMPDPQLFLMNLFDPSFGMYTWGPILLLALLPARRYARSSLVLPMFDRRWLAVAWVAFLLFTSANQYSRLQFNSGFRYLVPLVPFLMLAIADHWVRIPSRWRWGLATLAVLHSWVLTVYREPVLQSWSMFLHEGPQLPWYRVLGLTSSPGNPWLGTWWIPTVILACTAAACIAIWRRGERLEVSHAAA